MKKVFVFLFIALLAAGLVAITVCGEEKTETVER